MDSPREIENGQVIDIGGGSMPKDLGKRLKDILEKPYDTHNKPTLPDELLYDDEGLKIWAAIISSAEFYQTQDETALLDKHGDHIAELYKKKEVTIIDIGAGDTRKVEHLLETLEKSGVKTTYLALDISKKSLEHNVAYLAKKHPSPDSSVTCAGIWGTFQDGQKFVGAITGPRLFLSLGSVLFNDPWNQAIEHAKAWAKVMRPGDKLLAGMDGHTSKDHRDKIWMAYHSKDELYEKFFLNGFKHANRLLGEELFVKDDWDFCAELEAEPSTRHRFYFRAKRVIRSGAVGRLICVGEEFDWFDSHKYTAADVAKMCVGAGLKICQTMQAPGSEFRQYLIE
ncbi:hypothetical protein NOR_01026 [Metarhizium rileyi]|uniref:4-dimethylallyltryptophan N-methyltransferase n=1 Tax=Metarhizium rileyi (strain RCEF 4871) TaxID=1649241 RepID=A0A167JPQ3_METRR|nr:hypothetical protein NOR_01026 [Metarhizium rileyi RCEF 4871]